MMRRGAPTPFPAADGDFSRSYFYRAFRPFDAFPTYSERLASQDLQVMEIFEPEESVKDARGCSDLIDFSVIFFISIFSSLRCLPLHIVTSS